MDERLAQRKVDILTSAWPFTTLSIPVVNTIEQSDTIGNIVENIVRNRMDWFTAHQKSAEYYLRRNEKENAVKEYEVIISLVPYDVQLYLRAAKLCLDLKQFEKVKKFLLASLTVKKTLLAYRALGDIALREQRPVDATGYYEEIQKFDQTMSERLENGYLLALAQFQAGKEELSRNQLLLLLQLKPDFAPAVELLEKMKSGK